MTGKPPALLDEGGLRITPAIVSTPGGEYPVTDIRQVEWRVSKPLWGPVALALVGSFNLVLALEAGDLVDFLAPLAMFAGGLAWRFAGRRYVLSLHLPVGRTDVWLTRHEPQVRRAHQIVERLLGA